MDELNYILVYCVTRLHYSRLSYAIIMLLVLFLLFPFYFPFQSPICVAFIFQTLFDLVLYLLYLLLFLALLIQCNLLSLQCEVKTNSFILFSSRHIWKQIIIFYGLSIFKETCLKLYLISVLVCYLYFIMCRSARNVFGTLWRVSFWQSMLMMTSNLVRIEACVVPETLWFLRMCFGGVFNFQGVFYY